MQVETDIVYYEIDWSILAVAAIVVAGLAALITLAILLRKRLRK